MKKVLIILALFPLVGKTQITQTSLLTESSIIRDSGIKWVVGLSWQEIKEKAKKENKYIFLDCYATWCGPCKRMDKEVYITNDVGSFFNDKFISVKVQMDKTKTDNAYVQSWYNDVAEISKRYFIDKYPSFLFFSPTGVIVHQEFGYKRIEKFISTAQTALTPGKAWNDDFPEYERLMAAYKKGEIKYDKLPLMITIAKKLQDSISRELLRLHVDYVSTLQTEQRYTKENITFWSSLNLKSNSKLIRFFYKDSNLIDRAMQKKGYAQSQIDTCILDFTIKPFINDQLKIKNPKALAGIAKMNTQTGVITSSAPSSSNEADWKKLYKSIKKDFNKSYAKRNLQKAKAIWYEKNKNWAAYAKTSFKILKTTPPDLNELSEGSNLNGLCWEVFLRVKDKELISEALTWMSKLLTIETMQHPTCMDTYANLLYKSGQKELAIHWQEKALSLTPPNSPKINHYKRILEQMKKGEPTYGVTW
jgi:thioredoxin-related protein